MHVSALMKYCYSDTLRFLLRAHGLFAPAPAKLAMIFVYALFYFDSYWCYVIFAAQTLLRRSCQCARPYESLANRHCSSIPQGVIFADVIDVCKRNGQRNLAQSECLQNQADMEEASMHTLILPLNLLHGYLQNPSCILLKFIRGLRQMKTLTAISANDRSKLVEKEES